MNIAKFSPFTNGKSVSQGAKSFLKAEVKFSNAKVLDELVMSGMQKPRSAAEAKEAIPKRMIEKIITTNQVTPSKSKSIFEDPRVLKEFSDGAKESLAYGLKKKKLEEAFLKRIGLR